MGIVEVDSRFRITLTREVRKGLQVKKGQRVFVAAKGDHFVVIPVTEDSDKELDRLIGNIKFNRSSRKKAEKFLLEQVK